MTATHESSGEGTVPHEARAKADDPTDVILHQLGVDGRSTLAALSQATGLSVSAVQARVRRLESDGVIRGYQAIVDPAALGLRFAAFVEITPIDPTAPDIAPDLLEPIEAIEACYTIAGSASFLLLVRAPDTSAFMRILDQIRSTASVATKTSVILETQYERRPYPAAAAWTSGPPTRALEEVAPASVGPAPRGRAR